MTFSSDLNRIVKKTKGKFDRLFQFVTIEALSSVVRLSPVGNPSLWKTQYRPPGYVGGRFRGNWQISANRPASGELDVIDKTGAATIAMGKATALSLKAGQVSYVVNNLPYARALEDGHSWNQAPQGMVKRTAKRLTRNIQNEAKRLNRK